MVCRQDLAEEEQAREAAAAKRKKANARQAQHVVGESLKAQAAAGASLMEARKQKLVAAGQAEQKPQPDLLQQLLDQPASAGLQAPVTAAARKKQQRAANKARKQAPLQFVHPPAPRSQLVEVDRKAARWVLHSSVYVLLPTMHSLAA